jgi:hypothetical protein
MQRNLAGSDCSASRLEMMLGASAHNYAGVKGSEDRLRILHVA